MPHRFGRHLAPTTIALLAAGLLASATVVAAPHSASGTVPPAFATGQAALDRVGERLPAVAADAGLDPGELQRLFLSDPSLAVDAADRIAYFDDAEPSARPAAPAPEAAAPPVTGPEFQLSSLPGADKTIYLDFDGHVTEGTVWNSAYTVSSITSPPYDTDGAPDSWSSGELDVIRDAWAAVAEDFAPWNVNVTTVDPGVDALRRSGSGDTRWGARVVVTDDTFANCGCGGHAYLWSFDDSGDLPAFVYNRSFVGVAEAISHEVGHMLGLNHDGTTTGDAYYWGHDGAGSPGWAPIMGAGYTQPVTQWSRQEYFAANNTGEDDIAIISSLGNGNDFGVRADDHGDDLATATPLPTEQVAVAGIIETRDDVDAFSFTTNGADIDLTVDVAPVRPNLDVELTLRDSSGNVLLTDDDGEALAAGLTATVDPGTYTVEIDGVGAGTPKANPPSGYTDYGSLGQYTLTGTISDVTPPDIQPPAAPTGLAVEESSGTAILTWAQNAEADLAGYVVQRDTGNGFADLATLGAVLEYRDATPPSGDVAYQVLAFDTSGNRSAPSGSVTVSIPVDLSQRATGETNIAGSVTGTFADTFDADDKGQTITEVDSGGKPSNRHDLAEHVWTIPASEGNQTLTIAATASDAGDADDGFAIEWSTDGTTWIPLTVVAPGPTVEGQFDIGAPTGTIQVRAIDTDRTPGQRSHNSLTVDLLRVDGDGAIVQPPSASMVVASITVSLQSAGRGEQYGVATVQVNDDLGRPVADAVVTVSFGGDFSEQVGGTTDDNGSVVLTTTRSKRKPTVTACVASLTPPDGAPTYLPGTESC
jgi:hypothetical protein